MKVKCISGISGWQHRLRKVYNSKAEFFRYCSVFHNHIRLGFSTPEKAWQKNPVIQGSVIPSDYRKVG
jgi:hypothetical protein